MSDPNATQPAKPVDPPNNAPSSVKTVTDMALGEISQVTASPLTAKKGSMGAVAAICDALKELFRDAPKRALGWVCAAVGVFVVLCGVGIMVAFIQQGWPSLSAKPKHNWELMNNGDRHGVEVRTLTPEGKLQEKWVEIPAEVDPADHKTWAAARYGEQKPLTKMELIPLSPPSDTAPAAPIVLTPEKKP